MDSKRQLFLKTQMVEEFLFYLKSVLLYEFQHVLIKMKAEYDSFFKNTMQLEMKFCVN
jgi:hypothetical protein